MTAVLCELTKLPENYTVPSPGYREYKISVKALRLRDVKLRVTTHKEPVIVDGVTYKQSVKISWRPCPKIKIVEMLSKLEADIAKLTSSKVMSLTRYAHKGLDGKDPYLRIHVNTDLKSDVDYEGCSIRVEFPTVIMSRRYETIITTVGSDISVIPDSSRSETLLDEEQRELTLQRLKALEVMISKFTFDQVD